MPNAHHHLAAACCADTGKPWVAAQVDGDVRHLSNSHVSLAQQSHEDTPL
jgi:hypothetical protein